jgi:adenosylcobinamide-GDP ribazoletransferase
MQLLKNYLTAVQFFTRLPLGAALSQWVGYSPQQLRNSAAHFPGVGALVGALAAGCFLLLTELLPDTLAAYAVAALLSTVVTVLVTGGFHEDGLSDWADGVGGGTSREHMLSIMKDSRVGAFGVLALVLVLMTKVALLATLADVDVALACTTLFLGHVVSRALPLLLIRLLPHVGDTEVSKSKPLADHISIANLVLALIWVLAAIFGVAWLMPELSWWLALACSTLVCFVFWRHMMHHLQGFTGDGLGAAQQCCELAFYLGVALSLNYLSSVSA